MEKIKKFMIFIILILSLFLLTACDEQQSEEDLLKEKTVSELEFLENDVFMIVKKYLTNDYLEDENINWQNIKNDFEEISNSSNIIMLDLISLKIEDSKILEFENRINLLNSAIENKEEIIFLGALKELYKLIPNYLEIIYSEQNVLYLEKNVKYNLLESLYYCEIDDFNQSLNYIENAENLYKELINNPDFILENSYKLNRVYVAIQEMKLSIQNQEKENIILKYLNTID